MFGRTAAAVASRFKSIAEKYQDKFVVKLLVRTVQEMSADDATHMAAAVSYYCMLSLIPLTLGLIAGLSFFLEDAATQESVTSWVASFIPGSREFVHDRITEAVRARGAIGLFALVGLFWAGSAVFGGIARSINRAWDVHTDYPFHISKVRQLFMALCTSALFLISVIVTAVVGFYENLNQTSVLFADVALNLFTLIFLNASSFAVVLTVFLMLYKFVPNTKTEWRHVWVGAVVAAILFEINQNAFIIYLSNFANLNNLYGAALTPVIAFLLWAYISGLILIMGAEMSSEYGRLRRGQARGSLLRP